MQPLIEMASRKTALNHPYFCAKLGKPGQSYTLENTDAQKPLS